MIFLLIIEILKKELSKLLKSSFSVVFVFLREVIKGRDSFPFSRRRKGYLIS
jgi:hypothetical protein